MEHELKMQKTIELAQIALEKGEMPIAACIFLEDKLIYQAHTSEREEKRFLVHAEQKALIEADKLGYKISQRKQMQLFTTLEPCLMCYGCALSFFLGEIYFSLKAPEDGVQSLIDLSAINSSLIQKQQLKMYSGLMKEMAKELFIQYLPKVVSEPIRRFTENVIKVN